MFFGQELGLYLVCLLVVLGRIIDMTLATLRTTFAVKSKSLIAASIGFIEAFFWFIVVKAALNYAVQDPIIDTFNLAIAYSLGFALGTYIGSRLAKLFVKSKVKVEIVLSKKNDKLVDALKEKGYGETVISAFGANKKTETYLIFIETESKKVKELKQIIDEYEEKAFISVNESRSVYNGYGLNRK